MRVLQLGKYYPPFKGGMESALFNLCTELKRDVDLEVVVCNDRRETVRERFDGVPVTRVGRVAHLASTSICPTMPLELSRRKYDVLHVHFPHPMGVMSYLASLRAHRHAVVVTYHSDVVKQARLLKAYRPFMDHMLARADAVLCTSREYVLGSETLQPVAAKCHVVPLGIDLAEFELTRDVEQRAAAIRARYFRGRPLILGVGRLIYYKGFEHAIRAMTEVDAELLLIGDGPLRPTLEAIAREAGVADRVHFVGEVQDEAGLAPWYFACDVYALPSMMKSEAFAIVQLEAMACGKPIVNTAIPGSGVPYVSRDGESGLTVAPADAGAFGRALRTILEDRDLARRFGEAGRVRVKKEFSKEVMGARTLAIYREIARERGSKRRDRDAARGSELGAAE